MRERPLLGGRTVILTREPRDNAPAVTALRSLGAVVVELPCVRTEPLEDATLLRTALARLRPDDLLVLTSRAGADAVADCAPGGISAPVAAIGHGTAARASARGLRVTFIAERADGMTLGRGLPLPAGIVLLARADAATADLPTALAARGAAVHDVTAYRTVSGAFGDAAAVTRALAGSGAVLVFASPSAVDGLLTVVPPTLARRAEIVAIGPTTARRVEERVGPGVHVADAADPSTLARAIASIGQEVTP